MEKEDELVKLIIDVFYDVYKTLGSCFLEKVYENAMGVVFDDLGLVYRPQCPIKIDFRGRVIGDYIADFIVGDIVVEIKAKRELDNIDEAQLLNYLKATGNKVGLLMNFGPKPEIRRRVW